MRLNFLSVYPWLTQLADPLAATLVVMAAAALGNGALAVADGGALPHDAWAWLAIGAIALFSTVIAIAAFLVGIKVIGAAQASIVSTLEPVITLCLGVAVLGESVSAGQLVGGTLVLLAVVLLAQRPVSGPARERLGVARALESR